jgi:hypothetical protein
MMSLPSQNAVPNPSNPSDSPERGTDMLPQHELVHDHIAMLQAEAADERRAHGPVRDLADAPPGPRAAAIRRSFGRALIAVGRAIAATSIDDATGRETRTAS